MRQLYLAGNQLSGAIPTELGSLANLRGLELHYNQLSGTIPLALSNLASLEWLRLDSNQLSGAIPAELGNLASLTSLDLDSNQLSGAIPAELGSLANLEGLYLWSNRLSGAIPAELGSLANLVGLYLWSNRLSGAIPAELGNLANLQDLYLSSNQLSGAIPAELGNLANLQDLHLSSNQLSGAIPLALSNLANLQELYLGGNQLSGAIPPELGNLANLEYLNLSSNQLSGTIPPELGNLANLQGLYLSSNQLGGAILLALSNLANLRELYLSHNQLSGAIPPALSNLAYLGDLALDDNPLSGPLPRSLMQIHLNRFYFNSTDLCEPPDAAFQAWLSSIPNLGRTGVICRYASYLPFLFAQRPVADTPKKIAFFVSDMTNVFHQRQAAEAQKYAKDKYGAEVFIFDGKSDSATMAENVKQILVQDMDAASLHIWDYEAVKPTVQEALSKGIILTSFFSPLGDSGIPVARSDEAGVSFAMGAEMAKQWKEANPDKPIVMVQLGWPNHPEVKSGRTDPFVQGVLSVDPTAENLGCQDASKGADAAKQIIMDLVTLHPEINLIYSEAANLTVGTMAGLRQAGRGTMKDGKPLTEIVASADFDETEYWQVYDPNSSLKLSMGLPPIETGQGRIDLIMDVAQGRIPRTSQPAKEMFYKAYDISYWSMPQADAAQWLKTQFGISVSDPDPVPPYKPRTDKPKKIAFLVSDLTNPFHQRQAAEAQKYAKDKYGAEVFIFDGKSDSATMTANVKQILVQGMDAASLHIWDYESVKSTVREALGMGIVLTSFFSPLGGSGIPVARSDEAGVSFAMGAEMAKQWKATYPDKPIVMVELGWPSHPEVKSGRTDPFVKGVLSVDSTAKDLGCQDASRGADAAKQIIKDLVTQHPEVNLIYSEAANLTVGTMAGLRQAGRGKMDNGKPLTEIVASADFDEIEYKQMYDPSSSLKLSLGLPPIETGRGRIDLIMDVASGKIPMTSQPAKEQFYKAYNISYWSMKQAEAAQWLNTQFGTNITPPAVDTFWADRYHLDPGEYTTLRR